ncbi:MAG: TonB family protein [Deltaproteobacteria bacterium]|nr:TonB family protein [Deltaproteobacteria bacterium]
MTAHPRVSIQRRTRPLWVAIALALASPVASRSIARAGDAAAPVLTRPPALVHFVEAEYPPDAKAAGTQASVVLQVDIAADGHVTAATVQTSGGAAFDAAAVAAVLQFGFTPAEVDGKPSPIRILYQYDFVIHTEVVAVTTAEQTGVVRDRDTHQPLAGVTLTLDDAGKSAVTGTDGRFAIAEVAPGRRTITLTGDRLTALQTTEELVAGQRLDVAYDLALAPPPGAADEDADDLEIVVTAPPLAKATASVEVVAGQARKVPGTGGDVLKVVESMPGVARSTAGSGALVVWGAAPEDTRVYVDGVRIPRLYHLGGLRSVVATDLVKGIALAPGGWGVEHGRGLGGLVDVDLIALDRAVAGSVQVDAIDTAAAVRFPVAPKVAAAVALRKSQLAWVLDHASDRDLGEFVPIPRYADGQARLAYDPSTREHVEVDALASTDRQTRTVASADPAATRREDRRIDFWRVWSRYHRDLDSGDQVDAVVSLGQDSATTTERFGATPTELATDARVYGARAAWRGKLGDAALIIGLDAEIVDAKVRRRGSITVPAREGDVRVFGQPPPDQLAADRWRVISASAAPYAQLDLPLWRKRVHVVPGLRLEPYLVSVSRKTPIAGLTPSIGLFTEEATAQPRLAIRADATARLTLTAAFGRYRQAPQVEDLSAVFGSPSLPTSRATHAVLGAAYRWTAALSSEVTGFVTRSRELAVRSPLATPLLAQALVADGTGRAMGVQALVRLAPTAGVFGWISYTLSRADRTDAAGTRRFDYDQTHVLTAVASWQVGAGVELGLRFRYATGAPRTPVTGAYYDTRADAYQPQFGAHNGSRLPAFVQVDARASKRLRWGGDELEIYLDLQNATDRENAEEIVYSADYARKGFIAGLPILPVLGARLTW